MIRLQLGGQLANELHRTLRFGTVPLKVVADAVIFCLTRDADALKLRVR